MQQSELKAEGVRWDLGGLYTSPDDPRLEADLAEAHRRAEVFAQTYRGRIENGQVDGTALAQALAEYEAIAELQHRPAFTPRSCSRLIPRTSRPGSLCNTHAKPPPASRTCWSFSLWNSLR